MLISKKGSVFKVANGSEAKRGQFQLISWSSESVGTVHKLEWFYFFVFTKSSKSFLKLFLTNNFSTHLNPLTIQSSRQTVDKRQTNEKAARLKCELNMKTQQLTPITSLQSADHNRNGVFTMFVWETMCNRGHCTMCDCNQTG